MIPTSNEQNQKGTLEDASMCVIGKRVWGDTMTVLGVVLT